MGYAAEGKVVCGVGNCIGRVLGGYVSDRFRTPSRPAWFGLCLLLMALSQLLMACVDGVHGVLSSTRRCPLQMPRLRDASGVMLAS